MRINNIEDLMARIKPHLREYLEMFDTEFTESHFTCPNRISHRNEDGKPSAAFYPGPDGFKCFSCFKEDAPVFTDNGLVNIADIKIGDRVLSKDGNFYKVTEAFKKKYNGEFIELSATLPGNINSTYNHNIYYVDKNCQNLYYRDYSINKKPANELEVGDYLVTPIMNIKKIKDEHLLLDNENTNGKRKLKINIDSNFCKFLGLFIAEGNTNGDRSICLTFHKKEQNLINFVIDFAKRYDLNATAHYKKESKACTVIICNTNLAKWLKINCGHTSKNKQIPNRFLGLKDEYLWEIIYGIILGDGYSRTSRNNTVTTISKTLAHQLYILGVKLHKYPSVYIVKEHTRQSDGIFRQTSYNIALREVTLTENRLSHKVYKTGGFYLKTNEGEVYCKRIRKTRSYNEDTYVYNITVENTHNYNINGITVANCEEFGDIFNAAHLLEGKPLSGKEFITDNVLYLAEVFCEEYEIQEATEEELKKEALYKALEDTCMLSCKVLQSDSEKLTEVKSYIKVRGWEDLVDEFDFGFCDYEKLISILLKRGHSADILKDVGLLPPDSTKGQYEKYLLENRLIFPIRNEYGKIVAFGSRLIRPPQNDKEQKYLQSRNTVLYNKKNTLFNLDKARLSSKVYIVEGYADVFTLYKNGIENCVAICGLSFNEDKYKLLVKNSVQQIVFCLDKDNAGINALNRIIDRELKTLSGIEVLIKIFPKECIHKDVDEFINEEGIEEFNALPEITVFDYKLNKLKEDINDIIIKNDTIELIIREEDFTRKEKMVKQLAEVIDVSVDAVTKEVARNSKLVNSNKLTTSEDILEELNCFERIVNDWDRKIWERKSGLLGLKMSKFPLFTKHMDGLQNMFYLFAADTNVGKSAMLLEMAKDLVESNEDVFVLYFSVDDALSQLIPRMIASDIDMHINTVSNPKFKIQYNDEYDQDTIDKMILARTESVNKLKAMSDRFAMKSENEAKKMEDIEKYIRIYKKIAGAKQLVVIIDNIHRMSSYERLETRQLYMKISDSLKEWKNEFDIPILVTAELKKTQGKRPTADDIKEVKDLQYDADLVALLYSDFYTNTNTLLGFDTNEIGLPEDDDGKRPVVEMNIVKNKTSGFKKRLYMQFFPEYSRYKECTMEETEALFKRCLNG